MYFRLSILLFSTLGLVSCSSSTPSNPTPTPTPTPSPTPAPSAVTVSIVPGARSLTTTAYAPNPLNIPHGTTVTWINNDTSTHDNIADGGTFNTGDIAPGGQASVTFQNAGSFPYHCGRHPGMIATINVQ
jgi:plastocyanin